MGRENPTERDSVSKLSRRGLLAVGAALAGTASLSGFSETASAHGLTAFRDAFIGNDADKSGLGTKGWLFFAKDTETVYYHDGTEWQTALTGRQSSNKKVVETWSELQTAVSDLSGSGGTIRMRPGTYDPDATVTVPADVHVHGSETGGRTSGIAEVVPSSDVTPFKLGNPRGGIHGVYMDGSNTTSAHGVIIDADDCRLTNDWVAGFGTDNFRHRSGHDLRTVNLTSRNAGDANWRHYGDNGSAARARHFGFESDGGNNGIMLYDQGSSDNYGWWYGTTVQDATNFGIDAVSGDGHHFFGAFLAGNGTDDVRFQSGSRDNCVWAVGGPTVQDSGTGNVVLGSAGDVLSGGFDRRGERKKNLSGITGDFDGQRMMDDGTNTTGNGIPCVWDDSASVWQPVDGGSTFS